MRQPSLNAPRRFLPSTPAISSSNTTLPDPDHRETGPPKLNAPPCHLSQILHNITKKRRLTVTEAHLLLAQRLLACYKPPDGEGSSDRGRNLRILNSTRKQHIEVLANQNFKRNNSLLENEQYLLLSFVLFLNFLIHNIWAMN